MADRNFIDLLIRIVNAAKFKKDASEEAKAVKGVGDAAEKSGKQAGMSLQRFAKWAASAYIFKRAAGYLKGAVEESINLGKASLQLQRLTGLDVHESSEWVIVAHQRGIEANRLGMMFSQLGRMQQRAIAGSKAQTLAFKQVGISVQDLRGMGTTELIESIADAFERMPNGLQKAALAQQLFGRTGRQLLPLLNAGAASLDETLKMTEKYGAALEGKTTDQILKMIKAQRELDIAQLGLKEQMADALIPVLLQLTQAIHGLLVVFGPIIHNQLALRAVLFALVIAWGAYTAATFYAKIETLSFMQILASTGIGALLIGLSILLVYVATHWDQIRASIGAVGDYIRGIFMRDWNVLKGAVNSMTDTLAGLLNWVQSHWQLLAIILVGPFGVAAALIADNFQAIKDTISAAVNWIVGRFRYLVSQARSAWNKIPGPLQWAIENTATGGLLGAYQGARALAGVVGAADGGNVTRGGLVMVGERGPELVSLPRAAQVHPLDKPTGGGGQWRNLRVEVPVSVDGRELTRVMWKYTDDQAARR